MKMEMVDEDGFPIIKLILYKLVLFMNFHCDEIMVTLLLFCNLL
jgi:hypothetical protein